MEKQVSWKNRRQGKRHRGTISVTEKIASWKNGRRGTIASWKHWRHRKTMRHGQQLCVVDKCDMDKRVVEKYASRKNESHEKIGAMEK